MIGMCEQCFVSLHKDEKLCARCLEARQSAELLNACARFARLLKPVSSPDRIPTVMRVLTKLWEANPQQRLGQLLSNVLRDPETGATDSMRIFYIEDEEVLGRLFAALNETNQRMLAGLDNQP